MNDKAGEPRRPVEWWLNISFAPVESYVPLAELAEECGFTGVVVSDHLVTPAEISSAYPYSASGGTRWPADTPWPDCWIAITAMAMRTRTLRFVTSIYIAPLRDPFVLAKAIGTVSAFVGDRIACGFGAGWMQEEFDILGMGFADRAKRMDEMLVVMKALWSGEATEHHGRFFDFPAVHMHPAPMADIPIMIGGHADPALRRAARHDGWIAAHQTLDATAADLERLGAALADANRDKTEFRVMANIASRQALADARGLAALGVDALIVPASVIERDATFAVRADAIRRFAREHIA